MPSRLTWLLAGDETYGVAQQHRLLMQSLAGAGHRVTAVALEDGPFIRELAQRPDFDVRVLGVSRPQPYVGLRRAAWPLSVIALAMRHSGRLSETLKGLGSEALIVAWPDLLPLAGVATRAARARLIWQVPSNIGKYPADLNRRLFAASLGREGVTVASSVYQSHLLGPRLAPVVLPLGVDSERFRPQPRRRFPGVPAGSPVAIQVGRIDDQKGQLYLLEGLARTPELHLILIGAPASLEVEERLRSQLVRLQLGDRVHLLGLRDNPEDYMHFADFAVSIQSPEPFGLSIIEAMMSGKPVLASRAGGPAESIVDGATGWFVEDRGADTVSAGLRRVLAEQAHWSQYGQRARQVAEMTYSLQVQADRWARLLAPET